MKLQFLKSPQLFAMFEGVVDASGILSPGTVLADDYEVVRVLGSGGFGNTYLAIDRTLNREVAIKEFFPRDIVFREQDTTVRIRNSKFEGSFQWGLERFVQEAKLLAKFRHPNIVRVFRTFEANFTSYIVLDLVSGSDLETWQRNLGRRPTQDELDELIAALVDALALVHDAGVLHRDIKPANICIRAETGDPVLLDFGSSKYSIGEMTGTTAAIVSRGYSPYEAYAAESKLQGPWTDIYGLGATAYRLLTDTPPPEATERLLDDSLVPLATQGLPGFRPEFLAALDWSLRVQPRDRPQSVAEWQPRLLAGSQMATRSWQARQLQVGAPSPGANWSSPATQSSSRPLSHDGTGRRRRSGVLRAAAYAVGTLTIVGAGAGFAAWQYAGDQLFADMGEQWRRVVAATGLGKGEGGVSFDPQERQRSMEAGARQDAERARQVAMAENARLEAERIAAAAAEAQRTAEEKARLEASAQAAREARQAKETAELTELQRRAATELETRMRADAQRAEEARRGAEAELQRYAAALAQARRVTDDAERRKAELTVEVERLNREIEARRQEETRSVELAGEAQRSNASWEQEVQRTRTAAENARRRSPKDAEILMQIAAASEAAQKSASAYLQQVKDQQQRAADARRRLEDERRLRQEELQLANADLGRSRAPDREADRRRQEEAARAEEAARGEADRERQRKEDEQRAGASAAAAAAAAAKAAEADRRRREQERAEERAEEQRRQRTAAAAAATARAAAAAQERDEERRRAARDAERKKAQRAAATVKAARQPAVQRSAPAPRTSAPAPSSSAPMQGIR